MALKQKVNALKERIEHFKDVVDVKSKVKQRPGLMVIGSILAGLLVKKLVSKRHRHSRYTAISGARSSNNGRTSLGPRNCDHLSNSYQGGHWHRY